MNTVAVALAVRCRVAPPELVADADAVKTAAAATPAATIAIALPACRFAALASAPVSMIAPPSLAPPADAGGHHAVSDNADLPERAEGNPVPGLAEARIPP
jgi:hypothetical protein